MTQPEVDSLNRDILAINISLTVLNDLAEEIESRISVLEDEKDEKETAKARLVLEQQQRMAKQACPTGDCDD